MSNIIKGARIHCMLYGGRDGTISEVYGTPDQGRITRVAGGAIVTGSACHIDVVFDDGALYRKVPECIATGVQWNFLDEPIRTDIDIQNALNFAEETEKNAQKAKQVAKENYEAAVQACRDSDEYDYLVKATNDNQNNIASKNIKRYLKKHRPGVKFSVRKPYYGTIYVGWPKESESEEVNQRTIYDLLGLFKTGRFNSYEDYHSSESSPFNEVYGGVDYLICQRDC